ncbi:MAG: thiolase family protein [Syntrophales bacterium]|nr:thiolase family protein [Syntrophales bacterium]MDP3096376.1 thiolase family protein [Syntrophales bacterium]
MADRVAIVGIAQTKFAPKRVDVSCGEMAYEVIEEVLRQTGLEMKKDIDNAISCSHDIWDGQTISNIGITDVIGGHLRSEEKMALDGSTAVYYGTIGILSGEFDCTLLMAHTKMSQTNRNIVNNDAFDPIYTRLLGFDYTSAAALQVRRYMYKYGITPEQIARVVVKNLGNAKLNPVAHQSGNLTVAEVLSSPLVASPLRKLDIAPDTDGAVAMILASEKRARKITKNPVWIRGIGACYDAHYLGDRDLADVFALQKAAGQAYRMAGIKNPRRQIDVAEVGDDFSYQELLWMEGLGLCERGGAAKMLEAGATEIKGRLPVNPSGGLLGGVPINVYGLNRVAEAALQVMGQAGDHQVKKDVKIAVAQGHSGFCGQHQCVVVLGKE